MLLNKKFIVSACCVAVLLAVSTAMAQTPPTWTLGAPNQLTGYGTFDAAANGGSNTLDATGNRSEVYVTDATGMIIAVDVDATGQMFELRGESLGALTFQGTNTLGSFRTFGSNAGTGADSLSEVTFAGSSNTTAGNFYLSTTGQRATTLNIQSGATLRVSGEFMVGQADGTATDKTVSNINQTGGTVTLTGGGAKTNILSHWANTSTVYALSGGTLDASATEIFYVGWNGKAELNLTNDAQAKFSTLSIGRSNDAAAESVVQGSLVSLNGTATLDATTVNVGGNRTGTLEVAGGTLTATTVNVSTFGSSGTVEVSGGTLTATTMNVSTSGASGTVKVNGTGVMDVGTLYLCTSTASGAVELSGGGTINAANFYAATNANANCVATLSIGGTSNLNVTNEFMLGNQVGNSATVNQTGGTVTLTGSGDKKAIIAHWNSTAAYNLSSGTLDALGTTKFYVGWDGTGQLNLSGTGIGKFKDLSIGRSDNAAPGVDNGKNNILSVADNANLTADVIRVGYNRSATMNITGGTITAGIAVANQANGTLNISGGTINLTNWLTVGDQSTGTGTAVMTSGSISGGDVVVGYRSGANNTFTMGVLGDTNSNPTINIAGKWLVVGRDGNGNGTFTMNSGSITGSAILLASAGTTTGVFNLYGGTIDAQLLVVENGQSATFNMYGGKIQNQPVFVGSTGTGTAEFNMSGGEITNATVTVGRNGGTNGTFNMTGGTISGQDVYVGLHGTGKFVMGSQANPASSNPTITMNGKWLTVGRDNGGVGYFEMYSGTITGTGSVVLGYNNNGSGTFDMYGGTIGTQLWVGYTNGTATFNLREGSGTITGNITVGYGGDGSGNHQFHMDGGNILNTTTTVQKTSTFELAGGTMQTGTLNVIDTAKFLLDGGTLKTTTTTIGTNATFEMTESGLFQAGALTGGDATITGKVKNSGGILDIAFQDGLHTTTITNDYTQGAGGTLTIGVNKTGVAMAVGDNLSVGGNVELDGLLNLLLSDIWTLDDIGASFKVFDDATFPNVSGAFASVAWNPEMAPDLFWWYNPMDGSVNLGVPEPATWGMLLAGLLGLMWFRRNANVS